MRVQKGTISSPWLLYDSYFHGKNLICTLLLGIFSLVMSHLPAPTGSEAGPGNEVAPEIRDRQETQRGAPSTNPFDSDLDSDESEESDSEDDEEGEIAWNDRTFNHSQQRDFRESIGMGLSGIEMHSCLDFWWLFATYTQFLLKSTLLRMKKWNHPRHGVLPETGRSNQMQPVLSCQSHPQLQ